MSLSISSAVSRKLLFAPLVLAFGTLIPSPDQRTSSPPPAGAARPAQDAPR